MDIVVLFDVLAADHHEVVPTEAEEEHDSSCPDHALVAHVEPDIEDKDHDAVTDSARKHRIETIPGHFLLASVSRVSLGDIVEVDEWKCDMHISSRVISHLFVLSNRDIDTSDEDERDR